MSPKIPTPLLPFLLAELAPMNRTRVKQLLTHGQILVNNKPVTQHNYLVQPEDHVDVNRSQRAKAYQKNKNALPVLFEDDFIIAIDKPCGLLTVATDQEKISTAYVWLSAMTGERPFVVHRLDRETSGILLFAKTEMAKEQLQLNWDKVEKTYQAIVEGHPRNDEGIINNFLTEKLNYIVTASAFETEGSKRAITRFQVLQKTALHSLIEVVIETGRKHQIRVHLSGMGRPIVGDDRYRAQTNPIERLALHATKLRFPHPETGVEVVIESSLPNELRNLMKKPKNDKSAPSQYSG